MSKLLLFDIDGTMLLTNGAGIGALERAGQRVLGDKYSLHGVSFSGCLDPLIFLDGAKLSGLTATDQHMAEFVEAFVEELERGLSSSEATMTVLPGMPEVLIEFRDRPDVTLGMLTGNLSQTGPLKLRHAGIDPGWFAVSAWGDCGKTRPDLVPYALARYEDLHGHAIEPQHVAVIGDTPNDIDCAHAHGCYAFAVATGKFSVEELREAGADYVAEDLSDATPLKRWVETGSAEA
ncbi:MAG: HAD hydrolase-like protein [Phycisphaera sp.]|nr:HAD hydrolase-like protein [Phycisphaera sp.]